MSKKLPRLSRLELQILDVLLVSIVGDPAPSHRRSAMRDISRASERRPRRVSSASVHVTIADACDAPIATGLFQHQQAAARKRPNRDVGARPLLVHENDALDVGNTVE